MKKLLIAVLALCLALSLSAALADQTLEGDANVDHSAITPPPPLSFIPRSTM